MKIGLAVAGLATLTALLPITASAQTITIQKGDTLSLIADRAFGDPSRWKEICDLNQLRDCNILQLGASLKLPGDAEKTAALSNQTPGSTVSLISNQSNDDWLPISEGAVSVIWQNGALSMKRAETRKLDGYPQQKVALEEGRQYKLTVEVTDAPVGYRVQGTDKEFHCLDVGTHSVTLTASASEGLLAFWPCDPASISTVSNISLIAANTPSTP